MKQKCNTFFEIHERGFRLLKIVHELNRNILPNAMLMAVLQSVIPYIPIVLSAVIVDLLLVAYSILSIFKNRSKVEFKHSIMVTTIRL